MLPTRSSISCISLQFMLLAICSWPCAVQHVVFAFRTTKHTTAAFHQRPIGCHQLQPQDTTCSLPCRAQLASVRHWCLPSQLSLQAQEECRHTIYKYLKTCIWHSLNNSTLLRQAPRVTSSTGFRYSAKAWPCRISASMTKAGQYAV